MVYEVLRADTGEWVLVKARTVRSIKALEQIVSFEIKKTRTAPLFYQIFSIFVKKY